MHPPNLLFLGALALLAVSTCALPVSTGGLHPVDLHIPFVNSENYSALHARPSYSHPEGGHDTSATLWKRACLTGWRGWGGRPSSCDSVDEVEEQ